MASISYTIGTTYDANNHTTVTLDSRVYTGTADSYQVTVGQGSINLTNLSNGLSQTFDTQATVFAVSEDFSDNVGFVALSGGNYNDILKGGAFGDVLEGGLGQNTIDGGAGANIAVYQDFRDDSSLGVTVDLANQRAYDNATGGSEFSDTLLNIQNADGSDFNDTIIGDGSDQVNVLEGNGGADTISDTGAGHASYLSSPAGVTVNLTTGVTAGGDAQGDTLTGIEDLDGSTYADTLTGDDQTNFIVGHGGADSIFGMGGDDRISIAVTPTIVDGGTNTSTGFDNLVIEARSKITLNDSNFTGIERITVFGGARLDMSGVTADVPSLISSASNATTGGSRIIGTQGADRIRAGAGGDNITGGTGDDTLLAGAGSDVFHYKSLGFGRDILSYVDVTRDHLDLKGVASSPGDLAFTQTGSGASLTTTITINGDTNDSIALRGVTVAQARTKGFLDGSLIGSANMISIIGTAGNDRISIATTPTLIDGRTNTSTGFDNLVIEAGSNVTLNDSNFTGIERVTVSGGATLDMSGVTADVPNLIYSTSTAATGGDTIVGTQGADRIQAGAGGDNITGGAGNDTLLADAGADTFHYNSVGFGRDTLNYVDTTRDHLDLSGVASSPGDLAFTQTGSGASLTTTITINGDTNDSIALRGVTVGQAQAKGFLDGSLIGSANMISIIGTGGDDRISIATTPTLIDGRTNTSTGFDNLVIEAGGNVTLSDHNFTGIERVTVVGGATLDMSGVTADVPSLIYSTSTAATGGDTIIGTQGADRIRAGAGGDNISGGAGNDTLLAGAGADVFRYNSLGFGRDTLNYVDTTMDHLDLSGLASSAADLSFKQTGSGASLTTTIAINGDTDDSIALRGVTLAQAQATGFVEYGAPMTATASHMVALASALFDAAFAPAGQADTTPAPAATPDANHVTASAITTPHPSQG